MAKLGQGDARWIVADRADGTNVGGWHWQEKDVLPWAQQALGSALANIDIGGVYATGATVEVTGEAVLNNRKAKLIPSYEIEVSGDWSRESDGACGRWTFPYVADENAGDDDVEFRATVPPGGDAAAAAAFAAAAKPVLVPRVLAFVAKLAAGGPDAEGDLGGGDGAGKQVTPAASKPAPKPRPPKPATGTPDAPTTTVTVVEKFYARPADIYDALTSPPRVMAFTQAPAEVEPRPGGAFRLFAGAVDASFVELSPPNRLILDWRFKDWAEGALSRVIIDLAEPSEGTTIATVTHTGVPTLDRHGNGGVAGTVEAGWRGQVLGRLRQVFGYGVGL